MMKAILLNSGEYRGMENIEFPVEVDCDFITVLGGHHLQDLVCVSAKELLRVGMDPTCLTETTNSLSFFLGKSIEVKSENIMNNLSNYETVLTKVTRAFEESIRYSLENRGIGPSTYLRARLRERLLREDIHSAAKAVLDFTLCMPLTGGSIELYAVDLSSRMGTTVADKLCDGGIGHGELADILINMAYEVYGEGNNNLIISAAEIAVYPLLG